MARIKALNLVVLTLVGGVMAASCGGEDEDPTGPLPLGSIQVSTSTSGSNLDPDGYTITLDGGSARAIGLNGVTTFTDVGSGSRQMELTGVANNCSVSGDNPVAVSVTVGATAAVSFDVACEATSGALEVTTVVTNNFDPDGFGVRLGGVVIGTIGVNTTEDYAGLSLGTVSLELDDIAPNCAVDGVNPRDVTIVGGQVPSETFNVTCTSPPDGRIAYFAPSMSGQWDIWVANVDGTAVTNLTNSDPALDVQPTWSPDGEKIAFASDRDGGDYDIYVMNKDASGLVRITAHSGEDLMPAWSPDGTRLAFTSDRDGSFVGEVFLMNADGTGLIQLTNDQGGPDNVAPTWSADGQRIAFVGASPNGNENIYSIAVDGTDLVQLTDPAPDCPQTGNPSWIDQAPDWSPDGSRIVFYRAFDCETNDMRLFTMNADGTDLVDITPDGFGQMGGWPAWSPDGTQIVADGFIDGFWVMDADGANAVQRLAGDYALEPDWGP